MTWSEAREHCRGIGDGYDLVVINDDEEQQFLVDEVFPKSGYSKFWVGLTKTQPTNEFKWVDGSDLGELNWSGNNPNMVRILFSYSDTIIFNRVLYAI